MIQPETNGPVQCFPFRCQQFFSFIDAFGGLRDLVVALFDFSADTVHIELANFFVRSGPATSL